MVYRGLCGNKERENNLCADGPGGLVDTLIWMDVVCVHMYTK